MQNEAWIEFIMKNINTAFCNNLIVSAIFAIFLYSVFLSIRRVSSARKLSMSLQNDIESHHVVKNSDGAPLMNSDSKIISINPYEYLEENGSTDITMRYIPAVLTGLGIFGTFLGVSVALFGFPQNINSSTEMLVNMKEKF
jgi:hypothetical protein